MAAKFVVASMAFVACTLADPGYFGYGYGPYSRAYGYGYGRGVAAHYGGGSSFVGRTVWGLSKRSADAEPEAEAGYYGYGAYPAYGYGYNYGYNYGYPRYGATSYEYRSPQGLRGKRSADAEPGYFGAYGYGYAPRAYGYGYAPRAYGYGNGVAAHPTGYSYTQRSPQGIRGKRSAEPFGYYGYPRYAYAPAARSYQEVNRPYANSAYRTEDYVSGARVFEDNFNGLPGLRGKRSAEPEPFYGYGYARAGSFQTVSRPGSSYTVNDNVYAANVQERNANFGAAYGYGFQSGRGYYY